MGGYFVVIWSVSHIFEVSVNGTVIESDFSHILGPKLG